MKIFREPLLWILLQAVLVGLLLWKTERFVPVTTPDTESYVAFPFDSISTALSQQRTIGYPVFLKCVSLFDSSLNLVPLAQWIAHVACVVGFYGCLRGAIQSRWTSMAAASALLYSNVVLRYVSGIVADSVASSISIVTMGLLIYVSSRRRGLPAWLALAAGVFCCYQLRPAYLFVVALVPVLGMIIRCLYDFCEAISENWKLFATRLCAASLVPLLLFCLLRWLLVGSFGLVAFGANNFAGVVGIFLDDQLAQELPDDLQPLAKKAIKLRSQIAATNPNYNDNVTLEYMEMESRFDINTWQVFIPAAKEVYGDDPSTVNRSLKQLATAIVIARPGYYCVWLAKAFWRGIYMTVSEIIANPFYLGLIFVFFAVHAINVFQRLRYGHAGSGSNERTIELNVLLVLAISFAIAKVLLVIVTSPPLGRFMDPAGVFLPVVITYVVATWLQDLKLRRGTTLS